jgi:hypothetical protein
MIQVACLPTIGLKELKAKINFISIFHISIHRTIEKLYVRVFRFLDHGFPSKKNSGNFGAAMCTEHLLLLLPVGGHLHLIFE